MRAARILAAAVALLGTVANLLHAAAHFQLLPAASTLSGATYLPPSWLAALVLPVGLTCWLLRVKKISLALLATYALGVLPQGDFSWRAQSRAPNPAANKLSVVALNVQYYSFGADRVVEALKKIDADVCLLSENVLDASEAAKVSAALFPRSFRMGKSGETAIVSKYPILQFKEVDFPTYQASLSGPSRLEPDQPKIHRSFSHAVIQLDGAPVNVLSVRLIAGRAPATDLISQIGWGLYLMRSQNAEVEFLKSYLAQLNGPFVLGGDLNAPPSAPAVQALRSLANDAYLATHHLGAPTFRVRAPLIRIDYVFASADLRPVRARRVEVEVSDHFPVFAEFELSPRRAQAPSPSSGNRAGL